MSAQLKSQMPILQAATPTDLDQIGARLVTALAPGDVIGFSGVLGAGKSHLCRAMIRTLLADPIAEVPSPSYTLVNVYQTKIGPVWHVDLYRIADPDELQEIGLEEAMIDSVVLIEWPERLSGRPDRYAEITISVAATEHRDLTLVTQGRGWERLTQAWMDAR